MFSTPTRTLPPKIAQALRKLLPKDLPPLLTGRPGSLYEVLSRTPDGGVGKEVYQMRWNNKQIQDSYWEVTRTKFKCEGKHGKVWGKLYWKGQGDRLHTPGSFIPLHPGKPVSLQEEEIRGGLKYTWAEGRSKPLKSPTV